MTPADVVAVTVAGGTIVAAAVTIWPRHSRDGVPPVPARALRRLQESHPPPTDPGDGTR